MEEPRGLLVVDLAERISSEIRRRKLQPGTQFMNTAAVARRFKVNGTTANRALQLLAQRGILERRQRSGTFIADPEKRAGAPLRRVYLLIPEKHFKTEGLMADGMLLGLQRVLPRAELKVGFLPPDETAAVEEMISEAMRVREPAGFVLFRSSLATQRMLQGRGMPAVVVGTLQPSVSGLASIDRDQTQIGLRLVENLLARGARRLAIIMRDQLSPGDHVMLDTALRTAAAAGLSAAHIQVRCLSADFQSARAAIGDIVASSSERVGILCRSHPLALAALSVAESVKEQERAPPVALADFYHRDASEPGCPYMDALLSPERCGEKVGEMLIELMRKVQPESLHTVIPMELRV
ncbi:MAG TPA: GntR family transcriptional regulator [Planctomycetota bacterium]|nr:GntR family transcriptional regulator [Planctomycetota bacterium]